MPAEPKAAASRVADYDPRLAVAPIGRSGRDGGPLVIGQLGQSLDGRIATPTGASKYINGTEALRHLHRLRARVDAVIVGVGTAIADDPRLTTRLVPGRTPLRVVIDPRGRLPDGLAMTCDDAGPVVSVGAPGASTPRGVARIEVEAGPRGHIRPGCIIEALADRGVRSVLVEGGAETLARFIDAGALDELHLMIAPIMLGSGKTGLNLAPIQTLDQAMRPEVRMMRFRDGDLLCLCDLAAAQKVGAPAARAVLAGAGGS